MKRNVWIGIGAVLLVGGWLGYRQLRQVSGSVGSLVPPGALLMLASDRLQDTLSARALRTQIALRQVPIFDEARQRLDHFLYATADTSTALRFVKGKVIRYSLHGVSTTTLDFVFYVPLTDADTSFLHRLTNPDPRQYRVLNRTFSNEKIYDLVNRSNESVGSFILTDRFLVGSTSGILIENVASKMQQSFPFAGSDASGRFSDRIAANLIVDADHLAGLSIRPQVLENLFSDAGSLVRVFLPEELNLQFRSSASGSHLIGYAVDKIGSRRDVAALFDGQTPQRIAHPELIPQTTATLYHIGISNAARFGESMANLLESASTDFLRDRFGQIKALAGPFYEAIDRDVLLCRLESPTGAQRQVVIIPGRDGRRLVDTYQRIAYTAGARGLLPIRTFLGHKILRLNVPELPASLFGSLLTGFSQSWITQHGTALIVANTEDTMQDYLQQMQRGAVWSADERQLDLLNGTLRPANFTAFVRMNRAQTTVPLSWPAAWQNLLGQPDPATGRPDRTRPDRTRPAFNNLENMAYQASYGNENIQSTVILGRTTPRAGTAVLNKLLLRKRTEFNAPLIAAPIMAGSLSDSTAQFYAQNNANEFVLVTGKGEKLKEGQTDGPIRSNTLPVDFLNNGRLQYLFLTDRTLYVADGRQNRTGGTVSLTGIPLPAGIDPMYLIRPRGNKQRNLVALAASTDGRIFGLDRQKRAFIQVVKTPKKGPLLLPFQVIPTPKGMDILATQPNGTLNYWLGNGTQHPHFPVRIERRTDDEPDIRFAGPALLLPGQQMIQTIADEGQLLSILPNGLIAKRTQLYRPVRKGDFRLLPDQDQTSYLLLRTTDTEVAILNQQGERQFEVRALPSGRSAVRYHRLGAGVDLISVQSGGFSTLYDLNGKLVGNRPIPGNFPVALQFDERTNELYILSGTDRAVQLFSIRLR